VSCDQVMRKWNGSRVFRSAGSRAPAMRGANETSLRVNK
jgi:hypothetical protein